MMFSLFQRERMLPLVAWGAQGYAVRNVESQLGIVLPSFDVMSVEVAARRVATVLTGVLVTFKHSSSPLLVFPRTAVPEANSAAMFKIALSGAVITTTALHLLNERLVNGAAIAAGAFRSNLDRITRTLSRTEAILAPSKIRCLRAKLSAAIFTTDEGRLCSPFADSRAELSAPIGNSGRLYREQFATVLTGTIKGHSGPPSQVWGDMPRSVSALPGFSRASHLQANSTTKGAR